MPVLGESEDEDYIIPAAAKGSIERPASPSHPSEGNPDDAVVVASSSLLSTTKKIIHRGQVPKIHGVGPTENGVPITPRGNVDDEHAGDWYRTMYKRLHAYQKPKADEEVITVRVKRGLAHYRDDGYISEPEHSTKERRQFSEKRWPYERRHPQTNDDDENTRNDELRKKPYSVYRVSPKRIEDYTPPDSAAVCPTNPNDSILEESSQISPKSRYVFNENDGYRMVRIAQEHQKPLSRSVQREWYRNVQRGSDIPLSGFRRSIGTPQPKDPSVGPCPVVQQQQHQLLQNPVSDSMMTARSIEEQAMSFERDYEDLKALAKLRGEQGAEQRGHLGQDRALRSLYEQVDHHVRRQQPQQEETITGFPSDAPHRSGESIYETVFYTPDNKEVIMLGRAIYDFVAHASRELNLKKGDLVYIFKKIDRNWYEGECLGKTGIFPVRYVDAFPPSSIDTLASVRIQEGVATGRFPFFAKSSAELSFKVGDKLRLIRRIDHNWFEARMGGQQGLVPENYLTIIQEPTELRRD